MKKILITGAGSYIGMSFERYIAGNCADRYEVDTVDLIDGTWRERSFNGYDAIFHVAGIAHQKETQENAGLYYQVNRDLTAEVARKARDEGVRQFVFLSSMSVYGMDTGAINADTVPAPRTNYGKSKLEAENLLLPMQSDSFRVCILRPPMVYGKNCKGNFQSVVSIVSRFGFFPKIRNSRSSIHIDNLCREVRTAVDTEYSGYSFPQDSEYVRTMDMAAEIAKALNKKIRFSAILGFAVSCMKPFIPAARKAFGDLTYSKDMFCCNTDPRPTRIRESVGE